MPNIVSGKKAIKILCREFGFYFISQKGSHIKLRKRRKNKKITTIVPTHKELSPGTLKSVLELAKVNEKDFFDKI